MSRPARGDGAVSAEPSGGTACVTCVSSPGQVPKVRLLVASVRAFGGPISDCPFWVVEADREAAPCGELAGDGVIVVPLEIPASVRGYPFGAKVCSCALAEETAAGEVDSLLWLIPECLVLRPPVLMELSSGFDVAVRPVHIRNVGSRSADVPDAFWGGIYERVGAPDESARVESFIEGERIRPYFNSAAFSVAPSRGILRSWLTHFEAMVADDVFQERACGDERHRIFLHQAILSAVISVSTEPERTRMLPADYGYPYNLHKSVPEGRRAAYLNDLTCAIYEHRSVDPRDVDDIGVREPLLSWLSERFGAAGAGS